MSAFTCCRRLPTLQHGIDWECLPLPQQVVAVRAALQTAQEQQPTLPQAAQAAADALMGWLHAAMSWEEEESLTLPSRAVWAALQRVRAATGVALGACEYQLECGGIHVRQRAPELRSARMWSRSAVPVE